MWRMCGAYAVEVSMEAELQPAVSGSGHERPALELDLLVAAWQHGLIDDRIARAHAPSC